MSSITGALQDMMNAGATVTFTGGASVEPDSVTVADGEWSKEFSSLRVDSIGATFANAYAAWVEYRAERIRSDHGATIARLVS